jgi:hypothetical protein
MRSEERVPENLEAQAKIGLKLGRPRPTVRRSAANYNSVDIDHQRRDHMAVPIPPVLPASDGLAIFSMPE